MPTPEPTTPIEADVRLDEADYVEAFGAQAKKSTVALQKLLGIALGLTVLVVALSWPVTPGVWILLVPAAVVGLILAPQQPRYLARRTFRLRHPAWHDVRLTLDEEHLTVRSEKLESYRPWKHLDGWLETPRLFVLYAGTSVSDIWRKEAFSGEDAVRLRALLDRKLVHERPPAAARTRRVGGRGRVIAWIVVFLLLVVAYGLWRSAA
ncbi:MAG: YcxB family protein [Sandaracinaceae bacterium]|nr:YcxB family protein [Sandaracinaceae bacterium]